MACWSAENATKAYLKTLKMGKRAKEPDVAEFISALAAGNNAQLMVMSCSGATNPTSTILALVAAALQTGGRVVCILQSIEELHQSKEALIKNHNNISVLQSIEELHQSKEALIKNHNNITTHVEFVVADAKSGKGDQDLVLNEYKDADFVVVDCNDFENHEGIVRGMKLRGRGAVVVGYNAICNKKKDSSSPTSFCQWSGLRSHLLPIGTGLLVTRMAPENNNIAKKKINSRWVVKVDKCTGEEHVFRVRLPQVEA